MALTLRLGPLLLALLFLLPGPDPCADLDSPRSWVSCARRSVERGRPVEAADRLLRGAEAHPELGAWFRLSALQRLAEAGAPDRARAIARELREEPLVWPDSVGAALLGAALSADREETALRLSHDVPAPAAPEAWTRRLVPALLARGGSGDTTAAVGALRRILGAAGAPEEAVPALLSLRDGWRDRRRAGRSDLREGRRERGRRLLAEALAGAPDREAPRLALELGEALLDAGEARALRELAGPFVAHGGAPDSVRAALALLVGRAELRRRRPASAEAWFRRAASAGPHPPAAFAAYLLGDIAHDAGDPEEARSRYARAAREFEALEHGGLARIRLAFLEYGAGRVGEAAAHFRSYRSGLPEGPWAQASLYWEGRSLLAAGDSAGGSAALRRTVERDPLSWYGVRAAERLGRAVPSAILGGGAEMGRASRPHAPRSEGARAGEGRARPEGRAGGGAPDSLVGRMDLLRELGWRNRGLRLLEVERRIGARGTAELLGLALRLNGSGWTFEGIGLGWEVFRRRGGEWTEPLLRAVFPLPYREELLRTARREGLDPALLAAVVRQESGFDARARSPAGALGLTQLMPATARREASRMGLRPPREEELLEPRLNLLIGARHLAGLLRRYDGDRTAALVAYNAGPERYRRWRGFPERRAGEEVFVERIPFGETRRYVKGVDRNLRLYRWLHDLRSPVASVPIGSESSPSPRARGRRDAGAPNGGGPERHRPTRHRP